MISNKDFEEYTKILASEEDVEKIDSIIDKLVKHGQEILPKLLESIGNSKNNWELRYRFLKAIEQIGIIDDENFSILEESLEKEKDKAIAKKILTILSQANIKKCTKEFLEGIDNTTQNWKEIYSFEEEEIQEISDLLEEKKLPYRTILLQHGHPRVASSYVAEYFLEVPENTFFQTVNQIKEFLGMGKKWDFTGNCPACGTHCVERTKCPSCKINLEADPLVELAEHPFLAFLYKQKLLDKDLQDHPMRSIIEKHIQQMAQ